MSAYRKLGIHGKLTWLSGRYNKKESSSLLISLGLWNMQFINFKIVQTKIIQLSLPSTAKCRNTHHKPNVCTANRTFYCCL